MARTRSKRGSGSGKRPTRGERRRKVKQKAAIDSSAAVKASVPKPMTLDGFATLPHELRRHIVELACKPHSPSSPMIDDEDDPSPYMPPRRSQPRLDFTTTIKLALVSRSLYGLVAPTLYSAAWLSRPSDLASFHVALTSRPALGRLVKSLHVGPDDDAVGWDPLRAEGGYPCTECGEDHRVRTFIYSSFKATERASLLPSWCASKMPWPLDCCEGDPASSAIREALREAQQRVDIELQYEYLSDYRGQEISRLEHTIRACEVQAVFDLYLMAMRRCDDDQDLAAQPPEESFDAHEDSQRSTYPMLLLTGYPSSPVSIDKSKGGKETLVLSRSDILQHLARRGSITDSFDHPLVFARSGFDAGDPSYRTPDPSRRRVHMIPRANDWADSFTSSPGTALDYTLSSTATIGSLLAILRAVLAYTTLVGNLSLTGFLERAVCAKRAIALPQLRHLSLGPPPRKWYSPLHFGEGLACVEELRICGIRLEESEINDLVTRLPKLRHLQWSVHYQYPEGYEPSLERCIALLAGRVETKPSKDHGRGALQPGGIDNDINSASSSSSAAADEDAKRNTDSPAPLVEILLHPADYESMMAKAPNPAVWKAWTTGSALQSQQRRLRLAEGDMRWEMPTSRAQDLYNDTRVWWEEHC